MLALMALAIMGAIVVGLPPRLLSGNLFFDHD
jgi:hypothetical protein